MEVNTRVNYPLKAALVEMTNAGEISMDDSTTQFCTSWFTIKVADVGVNIFLSSWNQHPIPGVFVCACVYMCVCGGGVCIHVCMCLYFLLNQIVYNNSGRKHGMSRRVPDMAMMVDNRVKSIDVGILPTPEEAVQMYENAGGSITDPGCFGIDPLAQHPDKSRIRETSFSDRYPSISDIFHDVVNGNSARFKQALVFCIDITKRLSST